MSFSPTSPITGATVTNLTSPTYTIASDTPPNAHSKQFAVTALGGTQTGVEVHKVSSPFTLTMERPAQLKSPGVPNPTTGVIPNVPNNVYKYRVRKGVAVDTSGENTRVASLELIARIPAGSDFHDKESVRAAWSLMIGALNSDSEDTSNVTIDGIL